HELESEAVHLLRAGDWIRQVRGVERGQRALSNALVQQIELLSRQPFTIYLYHRDTLLFWSQPGLIIDPAHKEFRQIPCVIRDHRQDYYIKRADIAEGNELLQAFFKIPILPEDEHAYSIAVSPFQFGTP